MTRVGAEGVTEVRGIFYTPVKELPLLLVPGPENQASPPQCLGAKGRSPAERGMPLASGSGGTLQQAPRRHDVAKGLGRRRRTDPSFTQSHRRKRRGTAREAVRAPREGQGRSHYKPSGRVCGEAHHCMRLLSPFR